MENIEKYRKITFTRRNEISMMGLRKNSAACLCNSCSHVVNLANFETGKKKTYCEYAFAGAAIHKDPQCQSMATKRGTRVTISHERSSDCALTVDLPENRTKLRKCEKREIEKDKGHV
jgi:hypothetical protein